MEIVVPIENYLSKVKGNYKIICEREKKTVFEKSCFQNTRLCGGLCSLFICRGIEYWLCIPLVRVDNK